MSDPAAPVPSPPPFPPPGTPLPGYPVPAPPANGAAIASLVLGIIAACIAVVPLVNLLGIVLALAGLILGVVGVVRGRHTGQRRGMAAWGIGLSTVAIVVSTVGAFWTLRYLGDLFDTVDPPDPSAEIGEWFTTDDGDLAIRVTSVTCVDQTPSGDATCTFAFDARNEASSTIYLDHIRVKAVVAGQWVDPSLDGNRDIAPGRTSSLTGDVRVRIDQFEGLAFDADDASSHSAVVVNVSGAVADQ